MKSCDVCGNQYDKAFEVRRGGETFTFDSLECAIHLLAPSCDMCQCRILGHGIESESSFYCCAHCARRAGEQGARDRLDTAHAQPRGAAGS